jgi:hypothetical protein
MQEKTFRSKTSNDLGMVHEGGLVTSLGKTVKSAKIYVNGEETRWYIKGKYDLALSFMDGTAAIVDCKLTTGEMDEGKLRLYKPQLEAYAYAFENPDSGPSVQVIETGLLMWKISGAFTGLRRFGPIFQAKPSYLHSERDPDYFDTLISQVIQILESDLPEADQDCTYCRYLAKREEAISDFMLTC